MLLQDNAHVQRFLITKCLSACEFFSIDAAREREKERRTDGQTDRQREVEAQIIGSLWVIRRSPYAADN